MKFFYWMIGHSVFWGFWITLIGYIFGDNKESYRDDNKWAFEKCWIEMSLVIAILMCAWRLVHL